MSYDVHSCEPFAFFSNPYRKARKEHKCDACGDPILPGHRYCDMKWKFDGDVGGGKRCMRCSAIYEHLRKKGQASDMVPDQLLDCGETYQDHWGEDPPDEVAALAFALPGEITGKDTDG